ncbi:MAG: 1-acyl-sn-glycerol-3-phosphate acyltransferase [Saprospiraceae bacterium]|nr:1-acyl-sn-glycerol-3-phosphate acyltransferase [Saprospiraceae bacterium]
MEKKIIETTQGLDISENFVDIEKIFHNKNPKLARWIPKFVFRYIRRIAHEKDANRVFYAQKNTLGLDFIDVVLNEEFDLKINVRGLENINATDRFLLAANHPLGGLDGMALMKVVGQVRKDILFPVNDVLMNIPHLKPLFIPVNKHGSNKDNIRLINQAFASDKVMLFFPAGLVSRKQKGKIEDLAWQKTFIVKAKKYKRAIVPVYISGQNSNFFYRLANIRKFLGIKAKVEMFYLVEEMYKLKGKEIEITIGKPIDPDRFDKSRRMNDWATSVKEHVYRLSVQPDAEF